MAAIIRVKRRNSTEPHDALLIACKRARVDEIETVNDSPVITVVKFAGTVKNQDEDIIEHVNKNLNKTELENTYKTHNVDVLSKMRQTAKKTSEDSKYKIISFCRSLGGKNDDQDATTVIDIEDAENTSKNNKEEDNYVYDLYYTKSENKLLQDQLISVYPVESELVFEEETNFEEYDHESDDENSESNWRNDYPDESDNNSIDEDDMIMAMENLNVGNELSSEEEFAYGLNEDDINNYGYRYAKYKAKLKRTEDDSQSDDSDKVIDYIDDYWSDESDNSKDDD